MSVPPAGSQEKVELKPTRTTAAIAVVCILASGTVGYVIGLSVGENQSRQAGPIGPGANSVSAVPASQWTLVEGRSPVDDSPSVTLTLNNSKPPSSHLGVLNPAPLVIRCKERQTDLFISADEYLGTDPVRVIFRLDKRSVQRAIWPVSTDGRGVFAPDPVSLAKQMAASENFFVQITGYDGTEYSFGYAVGGLAHVLPRAAKACGW